MPATMIASGLGSQDARVEDFLDDKLQSLADLETLDSLLSDVQTQHTLLREQVSFVICSHGLTTWSIRVWTWAVLTCEPSWWMQSGTFITRPCLPNTTGCQLTRRLQSFRKLKMILIVISRSSPARMSVTAPSNTLRRASANSTNWM